MNRPRPWPRGTTQGLKTHESPTVQDEKSYYCFVRSSWCMACPSSLASVA